MKYYPRHRAGKRTLLGRVADLLMPHSMGYLGQSVPMPVVHPQHSHVRVLTADMVIDRACAEVVTEHKAKRGAR